MTIAHRLTLQPFTETSRAGMHEWQHWLAACDCGWYMKGRNPVDVTAAYSEHVRRPADPPASVPSTAEVLADP